MNETGNKPDKSFRAGLTGVALWRNQTKPKEDREARTYWTVTLDRRYQDTDGLWKSTNQLRINDIPRAIVLFEKAFEFLITSPKTEGEEVEEDKKNIER